jgi:hypothetical protein
MHYGKQLHQFSLKNIAVLKQKQQNCSY